MPLLLALFAPLLSFLETLGGRFAANQRTKPVRGFATAQNAPLSREFP
jgi:hypothetical protein